MAEVQSRPRKTVDDFMRLPEGSRAELIEGELLMSPSPKEKHQWLSGQLHLALGTFTRDRGLGRLYIPPFDVHLPSGDIVQPDLIFVSTRNRGIIQDWIRGVPDLLVEIVSPDAPERDRIVKRHLYERNGVPEYWIADPQEETIEVLGLSGSVYAPRGYFKAPDALTSTTLPGLSLPIAALFS